MGFEKISDPEYGVKTFLTPGLRVWVRRVENRLWPGDSGMARSS